MQEIPERELAQMARFMKMERDFNHNDPIFNPTLNNALGIRMLRDRTRVVGSKKVPRTSTHFALTINPREFENEESRASFVSDCADVVQLKVIKSYLYAFEQRGDGNTKPVGLGHHVHFLLERNGSPSTIERQIRKKFAMYCGNEKHIKFDWDPHPNTSNYIHGQKDLKKMEHSMYDAEWRTQKGYEQIYSGEDFTCSSP